MGDAVYDFLASGGQTPESNPSAPAAANDDPVHAFLASGGANIDTHLEEAPGYFQRIKAAAVKFNQSGSGVGDTVKAIGENALSAVTAAPVALLKHGVEEGAYLQGQSPEQAAQTAWRVVPIDGYQPKSATGQALGELTGSVISPLVDAGKWAAQKAGLSPAAQNLAGDFAPVVIPKIAGAAKDAVLHPFNTVGAIADTAQAGLENAKAVPALTADMASQGSMTNMKARFGQLAEQGNTPSVNRSITPQMLRGQVDSPESMSEIPKVAPELTAENASPQLQANLAKMPDISDTAKQRLLVADSLPIPGRLSEGQAKGDIGLISDEMNLRAKRPEYAQLFNEQNKTLIDNVNAIRDKAAPKAAGLDHVENGESLINAYQAADTQLKSYISQQYKTLEDANGGQFPLDGKAFVDAADQALAKKLKTHYVPADVRATLNDLRDGGQMTFEDFETLRSDLADTARSAQDGKVRQAASIIRQQLEDMPMPAGAEHLKPLADAARNAAKARFDLLDKDPAYKAAVSDSVAADDFVKKYIINGKKADLAQMRDNLAGDPVAHENITAAAVNYLKAKAGIVNDNGNFSQAGYNRALEQLRPRLDYLFDPVSAQQIQSLGDYARWTQEQPRGSSVNNSNTFVAAAKGVAEGTLNAKTFGLSSMVKDAVTSASQAQKAQKATNYGATVKLKDIGQ